MATAAAIARPVQNLLTSEEFLDWLEPGVRADLIGGCDGLIPPQPPKEAIEARRKKANQGGDHYHTVANPATGEQPGERGAEPPKTGYRPNRSTQKRRFKPGRKGYTEGNPNGGEQ